MPTRIIPPDWLDAGRPNLIVCHWTGGSYVPSSLDREHYHVLLDGQGQPVRGLHPVAANDSITTADGYAAHTRALNTRAIGVAVCAMGGATEQPFSVGRFPISGPQWDALPRLLADLCEHYRIWVGPRTVLTHAEVSAAFPRAQQRGKWDIRTDPSGALRPAAEVGDLLREMTTLALGDRPRALRAADLPMIRFGESARIRDLQRLLGVPQDGVLGPMTYTAIAAALRPEPDPAPGPAAATPPYRLAEGAGSD